MSLAQPGSCNDDFPHLKDTNILEGYRTQPIVNSSENVRFCLLRVYMFIPTLTLATVPAASCAEFIYAALRLPRSFLYCVIPTTVHLRQLINLYL